MTIINAGRRQMHKSVFGMFVMFTCVFTLIRSPLSAATVVVDSVCECRLTNILGFEYDSKTYDVAFPGGSFESLFGAGDPPVNPPTFYDSPVAAMEVADALGNLVFLYNSDHATPIRSVGPVGKSSNAFDVPTKAFGDAASSVKTEIYVIGGHQGIPDEGERFSVTWERSSTLPIYAVFSATTSALFGDFNADGVLNVDDVNLLTSQINAGTNLAQFDLNSDQIVSFPDLERWVHEAAQTFFGDANLDGEFNSGDMVGIFQAAEYEDGIPNNSVWNTGDWNGDAEFESGDLVVAFQDGGYEKGPRPVVAVPEPEGNHAFLAAASCCLLACRRRWPARAHEPV